MVPKTACKALNISSHFPGTTDAAWTVLTKYWCDWLRRVALHLNPGKVDIMSDKAPAAMAVTTTKQSETIKDVLGRDLIVKVVSTLEAARLTRACGQDAENQTYMTFAVMAASVRAIDGDPVMFPNTIKSVEAIIERLDDEGMQAVAKWAQAKGEAKAAEDELQAAKN